MNPQNIFDDFIAQLVITLQLLPNGASYNSHAEKQGRFAFLACS
jgi:hypothetical protein